MPYIGNQPYQGVIDSGNIVDGSIQTGDLANSAVTTAKIADSNITAAKIADTGVTVAKLNSDVTQLIAQGGGPKITGVAITNSSWTVLDDTAVDTAGGYIKLTGTNFVTGCSVVVGTTSATAVTFISSTELRVQLPAQAAGTYILYVTNPDGGTAIRVNAVTYSATPSWVTSSTLPQQDDGVAISIQLSATSATTYALQAGSTLPSGLALTSGGLLSGTVSGLANDTSYSFTVVATDAELQDSPRAFTVNIVASDPYFNLTTLVINGDTAPNVLTDASSNNFNLTAYGDARASNFTPYAAGWSVYFDGNSGIYAASNTASQFGTNAFTIEAFVYMTSYSSYSYVIDTRTASTNGLWLYYYNGAFIVGQTVDLAFSNSSISLNTWNHIAFTGTGGNTLELFINGVSKGTITHSYNVTGDKTTIGRRYNPAEAANNWNGYISNVRVTKGVRLYTANFTPETTNLTTSPATLGSGTVSLLTCLSNRLLDLSSTNYSSWTRDGTPRVTTFNPFNITNTSTSGSLYLDGSGDSLQIASNAIFNVSSSDITIELWYYPLSIPAEGEILELGSGGTTGDLQLILRSTGFTFGGSGQSKSDVTATVNQWYHVAAVKTGTTYYLYVNGTRYTTQSGAGSASSSTVVNIGSRNNSANYISGYIADFRISNYSRYTTSTITVPAVPVINDANTQLLTFQYRQPHNNHGFQDSSTNNHLITRSGNATQGTFSPFSPAGWSLSFTSGNGITVPTSIATSLASSGATFTIEAWVYLNSYGSAPTNQEFYNRVIFGIGSTYGAFLIDSTAKLNLYSYDGNPRFTTSTGTVALRTWTHVAASVTGGVIKLFIDGTLSGTGTWYGHTGGAATTCIGSTSDTNGGTNRHFDGYIAGFRLSNNARYNTSFNKPTSLYTTDANTVILTGQLNRLVDESNSPQALTNVSASIQAYSPFKPTAAYSPTTHGGSAYFDGDSDQLTVPNNPGFDLSTADFTLSFWYYPTTSGAEHRLMSYQNGAATNSNYGFYCIKNSGNNFYAGCVNGSSIYGVTSSNTVQINAWNYCVVTRTGITWTVYLNGVSTTSSSFPSSFNNPSGAIWYIGSDGGSGTTALRLNGYLSNIRLIKGSVIASPAIIPTTLTAVTTDTQLLLNFTDAAACDSTGRLVLETVNDSKISVVQKKYGTGAMYFDGNMDYIKTTGPYLTGIGTGNFTIEGWYNFLDFTVRNVYFQRFWSFGTGLANNVTLNIDTSGYPIYRNNDAVLITSTIALSTNTWAHVALVKNNGTTYLYVNGVVGGSTTTNSDFSSRATNNLLIGNESDRNGGSLYGYVDDFRITRYARYTGTSTSTPNFTPPAQTFKLR